MISVIVPVYNVEKFVEKCLLSITGQTFKNIDIIIVNDGSTDQSLEICQRVQKADSRIKIINQENQGLSCARNTGIKEAKGDYLTFIDSDDWVEPEYLEVLYNTLIENDADISICEYVMDYVGAYDLVKPKPRRNDSSVSLYSKEQSLASVFLDKDIKNYAWCKLYKSSLFENIFYPESTYYEDIYTTFRAIENAEKVVKINKILFYYVQHGKNITANSTRSNKKDIDYLEGISLQYQYIIDNGNKFDQKDYITLINHYLNLFYREKKKAIKEKSISSVELHNKIDALLFKALNNPNVLVNTFKKIKMKSALYYPNALFYYLKLFS